MIRATIVIKKNKSHRFYVDSVPTSMGTVALTFTITKIGLHRKVFIITWI